MLRTNLIYWCNAGYYICCSEPSLSLWHTHQHSPSGGRVLLRACPPRRHGHNLGSPNVGCNPSTDCMMVRNGRGHPTGLSVHSSSNIFLSWTEQAWVDKPARVTQIGVEEASNGHWIRMKSVGAQNGVHDHNLGVTTKQLTVIHQIILCSTKSSNWVNWVGTR